jgi:hypothetical protein
VGPAQLEELRREAAAASSAASSAAAVEEARAAAEAACAGEAAELRAANAVLQVRRTQAQCGLSHAVLR